MAEFGANRLELSSASAARCSIVTVPAIRKVSGQWRTRHSALSKAVASPFRFLVTWAGRLAFSARASSSVASVCDQSRKEGGKVIKGV